MRHYTVMVVQLLITLHYGIIKQKLAKQPPLLDMWPFARVVLTVLDFASVSRRCTLTLA